VAGGARGSPRVESAKGWGALVSMFPGLGSAQNIRGTSSRVLGVLIGTYLVSICGVSRNAGTNEKRGQEGQGKKGSKGGKKLKYRYKRKFRREGRTWNGISWKPRAGSLKE